LESAVQSLSDAGWLSSSNKAGGESGNTTGKTTVAGINAQSLGEKITSMAQKVKNALEKVYPDLPITYRHVFGGGSPYEMNIPLYFAVHDKGPKEDVYLPIAALEELMLPSLTGEKKNLTALTVPKTVTVLIGNIFKLNDVYITSVSVDWTTAFDESGYPNSGVATISILDNTILTRERMKEIRRLT